MEIIIFVIFTVAAAFSQEQSDWEVVERDISEYPTVYHQKICSIVPWADGKGVYLNAYDPITNITQHIEIVQTDVGDVYRRDSYSLYTADGLAQSLSPGQFHRDIFAEKCLPAAETLPEPALKLFKKLYFDQRST
jgi:hypothetical protein